MPVRGAIVLGAGQAGLAASYHLTQAAIDHVVLERGRVGEAWRSQRWDTFVLNIKELVDDHLRRAGAGLASVEPDPADDPHPDPARIRAPDEIDLGRAGVGCVIWACGFGGDFGYLPSPALDSSELPLHLDGAGPTPGLFYVGFPWLRKRKSGIIPGVDEDAARIVDQLARL
jgi:putative flavoprotein involved in K+ transport